MSGLWEGRVTGWTKTMAPGFEPSYNGVGDTVKGGAELLWRGGRLKPPPHVISCRGLGWRGVASSASLYVTYRSWGWVLPAEPGLP